MQLAKFVSTGVRGEKSFAHFVCFVYRMYYKMYFSQSHISLFTFCCADFGCHVTHCKWSMEGEITSSVSRFLMWVLFYYSPCSSRETRYHLKFVLIISLSLFLFLSRVSFIKFWDLLSVGDRFAMWLAWNRLTSRECSIVHKSSSITFNRFATTETCKPSGRNLEWAFINNISREKIYVSQTELEATARM